MPFQLGLRIPSTRPKHLSLKGSAWKQDWLALDPLAFKGAEHLVADTFTDLSSWKEVMEWDVKNAAVVYTVPHLNYVRNHGDEYYRN